MKLIRLSMILLAAVLGFATTDALAGDAARPHAVKLSDAELDNITAGSAVVLLFNPNAKAQVGSLSDRICINCMSNPFGDARGGLIGVSNPKGLTVHCIGAATSTFGPLCN